jgi:hypothetical protein
MMIRRPIASSLGIALVVGICTSLFGAELRLQIIDEKGSPLPARVLVRPQGGECVVPDDAVELRVGPDRWFMSPGESQVEVPFGPAQVRVERGLEYVRHNQTVDVSQGQATAQIVLKRWVDMKARGYLCGENHIHVDASVLGPMLAAEGLDFGTSLTWWNGPDARRPVPPGEGPTRRLEFAGCSAETSIHDAELEHAWGAAYLLNLPTALPLESDRARPNLDYLAWASECDCLVCYQAGWSREVALDALLGHVQVVNVCNNNFHLHQFQPRSRYSNLLQVEGFPVYPDTDLGMMQMNTDTYYRLLNWGLRLAAGAGSACGVKENPVGYNRAYVRAEPDASLAEFYGAWAAGRNFVTNGPMLLVETAEGHRPGDVIALSDDGGPVALKVTALAEPRQVLTSVEVVVNGQVVRSLGVEEEHGLRAEVTLLITEGSWLAARAACRDDLLDDAELARYTRGDDDAPFRQRPSRLRYAHTSPIYVAVGGRDAAVRTSIDEGFRMLDRFEAFARRTADPRYLPATLTGVEQAKKRLRSRLEENR